MIQRRIVVLLLTFVLSSPASFALAQTPHTSSESEPPSPGMQASVWRTYSHPDAEVGRALTADVMATLTLRHIDITVSSFDTAANASVHYERLTIQPFDLAPDRGQGLISETEDNLDGIGDQSLFRQHLVRGDQGTQGWQLVIFQRGTIVVSIITTWTASYVGGMQAPAEVTVPDVILPLAKQLTDTLAGADTLGGPETLWPLLPTTGDPQLLGLVPWIDRQWFPPETQEGATPETPDSMTPPQDLTTLPGVVSIHMRIYQPDGPGIGTAEYAASAPDLDPEARQVLGLHATIYQFDSVTEAEAAYPVIGDNGSFTTVATSQFTGTATMEQANLPDLGDQARSDQVIITATGTDWVRETTLEQVTVLDGETVIVLESTSNRGPAPTLDEANAASSPVIEIASAMLANDESAATPEAFSADGTSTGGFWNLLPVAGDPILMGMAPVIDVLILESPEQ